MSNCDDDPPDDMLDDMLDDKRPTTPELLAEAIAHAAEFLFDACASDATRITRGPDGEYGAIFILKDPEHVEAFTKFYIDLVQEKSRERVDVVDRHGVTLCNVPPDYESN